MPQRRRALPQNDEHRDIGAPSSSAALKRSIAQLERELAAARDSEARACGAVETAVADKAQSEQALRKSERRFAAFAEIASDWFWEMGPDLRFTYHSARYFDVTGLPPEDKIDTTRTHFVRDDMLEEEAEKWSAHLAALDAREPFSDFEYSFTAPDGSTRHVRTSGSPIFGADGSFEGYCGTGTDITATVNAQRRVDKEQQLFIGAVENVSDAFALFDPDDRLVFCNERFKQVNPELAPSIKPGMTFEQMLRDNIANSRLMAAVGCEEDYVRERLAQHRNPTEPILSRRNDGRWLRVKEERAPDGSTYLINTDITKLKQREEALQRAKETAERANNFKSDFLAKMSHELRTPLNAVIGFSEILTNELFGPLGNTQYQEYARDIFHSGQHLLELINDVLDLTKIEAGKCDLHLTDVDLGDLVHKTTLLVREQTREKNLTLQATVADGLPSIRADERAVRQILLNLLSNAVKFTPQGGRIRVQADRADCGAIRIVVSDNGIGISQDELETVLIPFAQLGAIETANGGGVGLGLPIVDSLVRLHGGTLVLKSDHGAWTSVTVQFPDQNVARSQSL